MSAIYLPRRWRHQPQGAVEVDHQRIQQRQLDFVWLPSMGIAHLSASVPPPTSITSVPLTASTGGSGNQFTASSAINWDRAVVANSNAWQRLQTFTRSVLIDLPVGASGMIWNAELRADITVGLNGSSAGQVSFDWYNGSAFRYVRAPFTSSGVTRIDVVVQQGSGKWLYINGELAASDASTANISYSNSRDSGIGRRVTTSQVDSAEFTLLLASKGRYAATADEIREDYENPYRLFRAPSHRIWFDVGAGAPAAIEGDVVAEESGADTLAATGSVVVAGSLAAAEAGADTFAATGGAVAAGTLAASETGADALAGTGKVLVAGSLAATEAGADTTAATGAVLVAGTLSAAETGADTFSASGAGQAAGTLAAVESGSDTITIAGKVVISGALSASEAGADTGAATGAVRVSGSLSASETGTDTFSSTGEQPRVTGDLAASEIGVDGFAAVGIVPAIGSFDLLEAGHDSLTGAGQIIVAGALGAVESGEDSFYSTPAGSISGLMAAVEAADSFSARGHGRSAHGVRMSADRGYQSMTMGRPVQRVTTRRPRQRG